MKKVAIITCYFDPDYVRSRTLRAALKTMPDVKLIVCKNSRTGLFRYPEMLWKIWQLKRRENPDAYLLAFRGQEILPYVLMIAGKKPVWFDEFIVPIAYAKGENHAKSLAIRVKHALARLSEPLYKSWLRRCAAILADTQAHAELSARTSHVNLRKYLALPVGTDETVFKPLTRPAPNDGPFRVFYYSSGMQPLHGIPTVIEAARILKDQSDIEFLIAGGKQAMQDMVDAANADGTHIRREAWIPFKRLSQVIAESGVCLAGPFGGTPQAQNVITTKAYQMTASQVPVIIGDSPATREFFTDKENALMITQADPAALAKAILWARKHPAELTGIALNGRKLYERQFSTVQLARRLRPLVETLG